MGILPVLDVLNGLVVRGIAGRRHEYRPIVSRLCASQQPLDVALAFRAHFGLDELYVADLDAIQGGSPSWNVYEQLLTAGFQLWVDGGIRTVSDATGLADAGVPMLVAGLETVEGPDVLAQLCQRFGPGRIVFSLDLRGQQPLGDTSRWGADPVAIAQCAIECGARRLIVLDLERVGMAHGPGTEVLCRRLLADWPQLEIVTGGGVRDVGDLRRLQTAGIHAVLLASALHDGSLTSDDLKAVGGQ